MKEIKGIILSIKDYREYDTLMQIMSEEGIYSVVGKGHRRMKSKQAPLCQLFAYVSCICHAKNEYATIYTLRSVQMLTYYRKIREDLCKQAIALFFLEAVLQLKEGELFEHLKYALDLLEDSTKPYAAAALFAAQLTHLQGIDPYVDGCVKCGSKQVSGISVEHGGFVCRECMRVQEAVLTVEELRKFRLLQKADYTHYALLESHGDWNLQDLERQLAFLTRYGFLQFNSVELLEKISALD